METLPTTTTKRGGARSKPVQTSKSSLVMAFFSCVAWLYVAGRLWQDAENRNLLASLLKKNSAQRPKVLTVEDKLMVLGCRDLERRIVEAEMELTLAKSQGYLKGQGQRSGSSDRRLLAVIGVYTGFGSKLKRNVFRGSWMPRESVRIGLVREWVGRISDFVPQFEFGIDLDISCFYCDALKKLEERGVVIRFVIGRSANRGDSLDRNIDEENRTTKDFLILEGHEEAQEELPKKVKTFFSTAVQNWDADFYVKVDDGIDIDLEGLIELLDRRRGQDGAYVGCMKSGEVISEEGKPWYEPDWWKFGDEKSYFRHAAGSLVIISKNLAQYININRAFAFNFMVSFGGNLACIFAPHFRLICFCVSLKTYAYDDTSLGSWMMGVQATYIDDSRLCCSSIRQGEIPVLMFCSGCFLAVIMFNITFLITCAHFQTRLGLYFDLQYFEDMVLEGSWDEVRTFFQQVHRGQGQ
ncbi:hypothetical protein JHK87_039520 [Glycine soja]|nr:hypothetical protein JHK87_039520 [Glycine soja]